jgi:glutamate-ammonia-ligase adenylyltransferase
MTRSVASAWPRVLAASRFVARTFERQREWADAAQREGLFERAPQPVPARLQAALDGIDDEAAFGRALRRFRNRELATLAFRDIAGFAALDETLGGLSDLADAAIEAALHFASRSLQLRHGIPRTADGGVAQPIVLGMGKLGGRELNFSSDVDLIFAYSAAGESDGDKPLSNEEWFARAARETARLLGTVTDEGFVFRVDTLLRPFGSAGALALSVDAMEDYYATHGREWERYALIKARVVAGDRTSGAELLERLRPFVYRRYLDFNALGALRELKALIDADAIKRGAEQNLKLGPGGIREIEFIVQLFQLTRGGQDARLRDARLRPVLAVLGDSGLLDAATARQLDAAYVQLRRCENAVQLFDDRQTHVLPDEPAAQAALAAALGQPDYASVIAAIEPVRSFVRQSFAAVFAEPLPEVQKDRPDARADLWDGDDAAMAQLAAAGFGESAVRVVNAVALLRGARQIRVLTEASQQRLRLLLPLLFDEAAKLPEPAVAALRALDVITAIAGRSTYLSLLRESAVARGQLLRLCAASPWIAELLARTPALLDALLDPRLSREAPPREAYASVLSERISRLGSADIEPRMELLRRYRQEMTLRIAAADLAGTLPLPQVSDRLTWLAEAILGEALRYARWQLGSSHGLPQCADGGEAAFAIIGYGKFGSLELGYGSDLDLVFVYDTDAADAPTVGGARSIAAADWFSRLAQRIVHLLATRTPAGRAYEVDLELRPSGNSGLVVTPLAGFVRYQRESAWTWEHQALLRARPVAGDAGLSAAVEAIRREVLTRPRDAAVLREDVIAMRGRMRSVNQKKAAGRWDVKQAEGGLVDAEFITQFLCLRDAQAHPALIDYTDNWRQLEALQQAGVIAPQARDALLAAERAYRGFLHRQALQQQDAMAEDAQLSAERAAVRAQWQALVLGESSQ